MSCAFTQDGELLRYSTDLEWEGDRVQAIREHVARCSGCREELQGLIQVQEALIDSVAPAAPSHSLDIALGTRLASRAQNLASDATNSGLSVVRSDEASWQPTRYEGISMKPLSNDPANDRMTLMLRMEPGAIYPPHHHEDAEECYMIEGSLVSDGVLYHAGDYMRAAAHSDHGIQTTETGCTMLLSRCTRDKVRSL